MRKFSNTESSPPKVRVIVRASWVLEAAKTELEYLREIGEIEDFTSEDIQSFQRFLIGEHKEDWHVIDDMGGLKDDKDDL